MPILATTSPAGTSGLIAGVLGNATTSTVFGGGPVGDERQSAGRIDFGVWLDDQCGNGVGVRLFGIEGDRTNFVRSSRGLETIAVPFYNIDLGAEDATLASLAPVGLQTFGDFGGSVNIFTQNDLLMGEIYARLPVHSRRGADLELIGGYHYVSINDGVNISSFTEFLRAGIFPVGTTIDIFDSFSASNEFHGAALGMTSALHQGCWSLKGLAKVSIGSMHQEVLVRGQTITDVSGGPMTTIGTGLFAQDSNGASSPAFERDEFTYIPEVELTLGYQLTDCVQLTAGYSFIYFPNVVLAGNQIDRYIDLPPQAVARPAFVMQDTDFWVQGVNLGLTWEY
jgi:hypothetical protein